MAEGDDRRASADATEGRRDPGQGSGSLAERVLSVSRRLRRGWLTALEPWGITPHQARALRIVARQDGIRPGVLAAELRVAPRSATDVVDALERQGWVRRDADPADRRAMIVLPTPAGEEIAAVAERARAEWAQDVFAPLTAAERAELTRLLDIVLDAPTP